MNLSDLIGKLETLGNVRRSGDGFLCTCPAHEDTKTSLSVKSAKDGTLLLKCHAGCDTAKVVKSLGITLKDLFPHHRWEEPYICNSAGTLVLDTAAVEEEPPAAQEAEGTVAAETEPPEGPVAAKMEPPEEPEETDAEPPEEVDDDEDLDLPELAPLKSLKMRSGISAIMNAVEDVGKAARTMDALKREMCREAAARKLRRIGYKTPGRLLDAAFPVEKPKEDPEEMAKKNYLADVTPWEEEVEGQEILGELVKSFQRWLILPDGAVETAALWVLFAHAHNAFSISPTLVVSSPQKQCGKSTMLFVLEALVPRPMYTAGTTAATLFRSIELWRPTLLIDEADTFLGGKKDGGKEALRGCLNSGHARRSAVITRCDGDDHVPTQFSTWSPKSIALIGKLPDTLEARSINVHMKRKKPSEQTQELRLDQHFTQLEPVLRKAARWAADHMDELRHADPQISDNAINDRAKDNWRPLLSIADLVGGEWPQRARWAMMRLLPKRFHNETASTLLLYDVHAIFTAKKADRLYTETLLKELHKMEERPWPEWGRKMEPLSATGMAKLLEDFDIGPKLIRAGKKVQRGYELAQFEDACRRYAPQVIEEPSSQDETQAPATKNERKKKADAWPDDWPGHDLVALWLSEHPFWQNASEPVKTKALPQLQQAVDALLRIDGREPLEVQAMLRWVIADAPNGTWKGWASVMRSPEKLRDRTRDKTCTYWDLISQQMGGNGPDRTGTRENWEDCHEI